MSDGFAAASDCCSDAPDAVLLRLKGAAAGGLVCSSLAFVTGLFGVKTLAAAIGFAAGGCVVGSVWGCCNYEQR